MNDLIVIQASQGLCHYVLKQIENASSKGIVIGHDHRHNSERWAKLTAAAFLKNGVKVYLHQGLVHTPIEILAHDAHQGFRVPFTVKRVGAACGVMITGAYHRVVTSQLSLTDDTASHNPKIISPHDKGISDSIKVNLEPQTWDTGLIESPLSLNVTDEMKQAYFMSLLDLKNLQLPLSRRCKFINTSMHGVGHPFVEKALGMLGISIIPVPEQQHPDPEFPTVSYPNPEEKGALDLAIAVAKRQQQKEEVVILAQDPDADRFTAVEKQLNGEWVTFTGDQVGVIFAGQVMEAYRASGKPMSKLAMVASTVSSKMVEAMAEVEGFKFVECLTGFKYIGNTALDLVAQGFEVPFGYEEAIGFMFGSEVRDKDGVAASGKTVKSYLDELYKRYGYFKDPTAQGNRDYPKAIAGLTITSVVDLTTGYDSRNPPAFKPSLPLSSGHMIQFKAENKTEGTKVCLTTRTSGTEPKIKYYLEGSGSDREQVTKTLNGVVQELRDVWMEAEKNHLGIP
ncbi:hypothetical protein D9758_003122 [Tetrapyrgos nigripes]|uniref:Phosphoglucomutase n=1 Tax=Tetrapyrgos nigripes TaxID=182062 RepID=A0A8H5GPL6_9AGAR|nr:hypothetical protein D9758_003122 [Tetrapyrgos nigripes]